MAQSAALMLPFFIAVLGALLVAWGRWVGVVAIATRMSEARLSRIHQEALSKISTEEVELRAQNWPYLVEHAQSEAVRTFRALLSARRYDELLRDWKHHAAALFVVAADEHPGRPAFVESGSAVALRDYVVVLSKRQRGRDLFSAANGREELLRKGAVR